MIRYLYGEDTYRAREVLAGQAKQNSALLRWIDRQDLVERGAAEVVGRGANSLFGKETLVFRDVGDWPKGLQSELLAALEKAGEALDGVLWDRGKVDRRSIIYKKFKKIGQQFSLPTAGEVQRWLVQEARRRGGTIQAAAAGLMISRLGVDRWRLSGELDKLLLVNNQIDQAVVRRVIPESSTAEIFSMLDALARGDRQRAVQSVVILLEGGDSEFYILSMLAYQFRTLLNIRRGIDRGMGQALIASEGGLKPYSVSKNYNHAMRFAASYLHQSLTRILATDFAIRQGRVETRTGLLMLVLSLAR